MERHEIQVTCPYCWESIEILIEPDDMSASYSEDCSVCCHPMRIVVRELAGQPEVQIEREL